METLRNQAGRALEGSLSLSELKRTLKSYFDTAELERVAGEFTPHTEISVPLLGRVLEIEPDNINAMADLGFLHWLDGDDQSARRYAEAALRANPENIKALLLRAAASSSSAEKLLYYSEVLRLDPQNQAALENVQSLNKPTCQTTAS